MIAKDAPKPPLVVSSCNRDDTSEKPARTIIAALNFLLRSSARKHLNDARPRSSAAGSLTRDMADITVADKGRRSV